MRPNLVNSVVCISQRSESFCVLFQDKPGCRSLSGVVPVYALPLFYLHGVVALAVVKLA